MVRVQNGTGAPVGKYRSHSIHPVRGAHGSTRKVVGSGTRTMSPAPRKPGTPTPVSEEKTAKTDWPEVSFSRSELGAVTPFFRAPVSAPRAIVLLRTIPCWSTKAKRTNSMPSSSTTRRICPRAAYCASVHSPWFPMNPATSTERIGRAETPPPPSKTGRSSALRSCIDRDLSILSSAGPRRSLAALSLPFHPARLPRIVGRDGVHRHRPGQLCGLFLAQRVRGRLPSGGERVDGAQEHAAVRGDGAVGDAETLDGPVLDGAHRLHGPLVVH